MAAIPLQQQYANAQNNLKSGAITQDDFNKWAAYNHLPLTGVQNNQDIAGPSWNGNITDSPGVKNYGVTYHDPAGVVNTNQGVSNFYSSGLPSSDQNQWMQDYINANRQDGGASSSNNTVKNNWGMFNQDKQKMNQQQISGIAPIQNGQSELMSQGGKSYYVTDNNGQYYMGAVPDALAPNAGGPNSGGPSFAQQVQQNHTAQITTHPTTGQKVWKLADQNGKVTTGTDYNQIVNSHGGQWLNHKWVDGQYVNGQWTPGAHSTGSSSGSVAAATGTASANTGTTGFDPQTYLNSLLNPALSQIQQEAQQEYQQQMKSYQDEINQYKQEMTNAQNESNATLQNQASQLNNTTFQNWLKDRNKLEQQGLSNSGFVNDAQTREGLNQQDQLQNLYNTATTSLENKDSTIQNAIDAAVQKQQAVSPSSIYGTLYNQEIPSLLNQFKDVMPYITPTAAQQQSNQTALEKALLPYQYQTANQQAIDTLNQQKLIEQELNSLGLGVNPSNGSTAETLQALQDQFNNALGAGKLTGYYGGSPTLAAQQLMEKTANDTATQNYHNQLMQLDQSKLTQTINKDNATAAHWAAQDANTSTSHTTTALYDMVKSLSTQMKGVLTADPNASKKGDAAYASYNVLAQQYASAMNALAQSTGNSFQNSGGGGDYAKYTGSLTPMPTPQLQGLFQDALRLTGESANSANINALMNIAKAESSYEPGATYQGPLVPGVTATNRPTGLMQVEPQTFAANAMSGYSNIKNPLDNVIAAINYMKKEYGGIQQAYTYRQAHGAY